MKIILTSIFLLVLSACNGGVSSTDQSNAHQDSNAVKGTDQNKPPVETNQANTDYKPAFEGQTRIAGGGNNDAL